MTSARRSVRALWAMPWRDRWLVCQAAIGLVSVELLMPSVGVRRCHDGLARLSRHRPCAWTHQEVRAYAAHAARLVAQVARHGPTGSACLAQALVLWGMLRRRGIDAELKIGVAKASGRLEAHAWVMVCGEVLSADRDVEDRYVPLDIAWPASPERKSP